MSQILSSTAPSWDNPWKSQIKNAWFEVARCQKVDVDGLDAAENPDRGVITPHLPRNHHRKITTQTPTHSWSSSNEAEEMVLNGTLGVFLNTFWDATFMVRGLDMIIKQR
jgi:hypothetical protein